jgi:VanZ family protein
MALLRRQKLVVIMLLFYWPSVFIFAHIPIPDLVHQAGVSDKSVHFVAYWILAFLLWCAVNPKKKVKWSKAVVWWILFLIAAYGIIDEWLQGYVAGRDPDIMDFFLDVAGALAGLVVLTFFAFWSASLVITGVTIFVLTNVTRVDMADLLPVTNGVLHVFAYAFFTVLWIRYVHLRTNYSPRCVATGELSHNPGRGYFPCAKVMGAKWLIVMLASPVGLLLATKLGSLVLGRDFTSSEMIISMIVIGAVVAVAGVGALIRRVRKA